MIRFISISAAMLLLLSGFAATHIEASVVTITTADGGGADARVKGGGGTSTPVGNPSLTVDNGATNFGAADLLEVRFAPLAVSGGTAAQRTAAQINNSRKSYLRFDLSVLTLDVMIAELQLTLTNDFTIAAGGVTFQLYALNDLPNQDGWIESGAGSITWNNAPSNVTTSPNGFAPATLLAESQNYTGTFSQGDTVSFSSASLVNFLNTDTNNLVTFMITSKFVNPTNVYTFASKENQSFDIPTLFITQVPEPSSIVLLGLGLVGFVGLARRRKK